ncbi:MAG: thioredoxin [Actinomycetota bacterium]|nr:thioredoxin [Actinomycetota bacterium]
MSKVLEVNEENFDSEILKAEKAALVDFWASWCGPCRMMHPIIESLSEDFEDRAVVARCNVDENPSLAGRYGVTAIPTLIIFKGGEAVDTLIGVTPAEELKSRLEAQL